MESKSVKHSSILDLPEDERKKVEARFWAKVEKTPTCWNWKGYICCHGYGELTTSYKHHYAHRVSYELHKGRIPEDKQIDHLCRNRACVNPDHLEPVSNTQNTLRGDNFIAINAQKVYCPRGHLLIEGNLRQRKKGGRECLICHKESVREWHKEHPNYMKEYVKNVKIRRAMQALERGGQAE